MTQLKSDIKNIFCEQLELLELSDKNISKDIIELKLNTIIENLVEKIDLNKYLYVPLKETTNENVMDGVEFDDEKSSDVELSDNTIPLFQEKTIETNKQPNESTPIQNNFRLSYEMEQFARSKFVQNVTDMFEDFKLYYQSKGTLNSDWEAVWKRWVLNNNRYKKHLVKTTIKEDMKLTDHMISFAKEYITKDAINLEFQKFKNHYLGTGDLKASWDKVWQNWCIHHKQFKPKEQSQKSQEKQNYRWDFRKAKDVSDKIKDWLEFEKGINWLDDFYWKNRPIPGIGWQKVIHPDFNKEEILLYKIDSPDGSYMLEHKTEEIIDAEILETSKT
ncbi:MAG: hypothetical protein U9Q04_03255 [Campylobacterota bacterium]|nr:hypothetical protein [Campylobacterota bacterium]